MVKVSVLLRFFKQPDCLYRLGYFMSIIFFVKTFPLAIIRTK
jgi:hypothetical protein